MTGLKFFLHNLKKNPLSFVGFTVIFIFIIIAIFAPLIAPTPKGQFNAYMIPRAGYTTIPRPPNAAHPFGTTEGQYDIFYGVIWGTRTALLPPCRAGSPPPAAACRAAHRPAARSNSRRSSAPAPATRHPAPAPSRSAAAPRARPWTVDRRGSAGSRPSVCAGRTAPPGGCPPARDAAASPAAHR